MMIYIILRVQSMHLKPGEHIKVCPDCKKQNNGRMWYNKCDPDRFTSGNREIDKIIHEAQCKTRHYDDNLEWIPYDRFQDLKLIGEGGFAKIYSATWLNGDNRIKRNGPIIVALKKLKNSNSMTEAFINEVNKYFSIQLFRDLFRISHKCIINIIQLIEV